MTALARIAAAGAVAAVWVITVAIAHVRARASELALELGPILHAYAGVGRDEGRRTLVVNGARLEMRTGVTPDSIETVLARERQACGPPRVLQPIVQRRSAIEGVLGCLVGAPGSSAPELRLTWVMASGEERRYVRVASRDTLALARMFPGRGDCPGTDVPGLPRPPHSERVLSAFQDGSAPMLVAYRSAVAPDALERMYREVLEREGRRVERSDAGGQRALLVHDVRSAHLVLIEPDQAATLAVFVPLPTQPSQ
jgi:hypothetical protein